MTASLLELVDWKTVVEAEREEIRRRMGVDRKRPPEDFWGLAISGGGIRSATFALGVLQALAAGNHLSRFDYLSTVSGGGYLGTSLSWLLSSGADSTLGLGPENFPYGTDDPEAPTAKNDESKKEQRDRLDFLRNRCNYLAPSQRITLMSGIAVVLRGMITNLVTWLPLFAAFFALLQWAHSPETRGAFILSVFFTFWCVGYGLATWQGMLRKDLSNPFALAYKWILTRILDGCLRLVRAFRALRERFRAADAGPPPWRAAREKLSEKAYGGDSENDRYELRRGYDVWAGAFLKWTVAILVLASLPFVDSQMQDEIAEAGIVSFSLGALSGLVSFLHSGKEKFRLPLTVLASLGAALLLYGVLLIAYWLPGAVGLPWVFALLALAVASGWLPNQNLVGLHRFYRDRLMEAFMAAPSADSREETGESPDGNKKLLADIASGHGPYHLINTNVVLVDSADLEFKRRGGDSFLLSPLFCGSHATGYRPTREFLDGRLTLASAMAISGAAANPNTGVGGVGPMRNQWVALLMSLLNIRLGFWIPHPKRPDQDRRPSQWWTKSCEIRSDGYDEDEDYLELSDGGHFDNLGLYELVRRRCGFILVIDGATDPDARFGDLRIVSERVWEDFQARIDFETELPIEDMIPGSWKNGRKEPISDAPLAKRGFAIGRIVYYDESGREERRGTLVYVKSTLVRDLSLRVRGYRRAHPTFPDESVGDQFFDESQFEAHRHLGYKIGKSLHDEDFWACSEEGRSEYPSRLAVF